MSEPTPTASRLAALRRLLPAGRARRALWLAFLAAQWVVVPLLWAKFVRSRTRDWPSVAYLPSDAGIWNSWEKHLDAGPAPDFVFVGSSRVAAAIDPEAFTEVASEAAGRPLRAVNFGLGYSTMALHYLNLRNQVARRPDLLRHATVFIEAPGGLPADPSGWNDPWCHPDRPQFLPPLLRAEDLPSLWARAGSFEERVRATFEMAVRGVPLLHNRERVGHEFVGRGDAKVMSRLGGLLPGGAAGFGAVAPPPAPAADLTTRGGIRNDSAGVAAARAAAQSMARKELADLKPVAFADDCVLADLVRLVQKAGGKVVFFAMPLHSTQVEVFRTETRRRDREAFVRKAGAWGCEIIATDFPTADADFPDVWHMRRSLAPDFSRALALAWVGSRQ
jgi:hypothetical protein